MKEFSYGEAYHINEFKNLAGVGAIIASG